MQFPQTEHIRSALHPSPHNQKNSAETTSAQDDAMPIATDNGARMPQSPRNGTMPHLIPENAYGKGNRKAPRTGTLLRS